MSLRFIGSIECLTARLDSRSRRQKHMTIWIIEIECDDQYYAPHFVSAYSTEKLAEKALSQLDDYNKKLYEITEVELDSLEYVK